MNEEGQAAIAKTSPRTGLYRSGLPRADMRAHFHGLWHPVRRIQLRRR
jgi:hypothetical protein